ncbi:MAG: acetate--CoA ligase family protein [Candidatus Marinimicrobia bacterium]|nr:acetate--CoA ligase family protein [Candidatus Neomarinimicrobiota bacterium]
MTEKKEIHLRNLEKLFYPDSVAIVGANKVQGTVPHDILKSILKADFNGVVYPVSPKEKFIAGIKTYKYVTDIEDPIDLAIIVFPASVCHMALEQCGQKGIKSAIIISAGFKEVGPHGLAKELQIKAIADKYDMSFIGPNCLGVINTDPRAKINASFARQMPEEGSIGFLSQSGALCTAVLDYAQAKHIGFSKFISFGNKTDISEIDLLYYLKDDPKTKIILMYLEEVSDGQALMKAARDVISESGKPILILKSGRTKEGAAAAASHTGSLAGSDEICDAAFKQAGIIRCSNMEEMFNIAKAFAYQPIPKSNKVAIITNAGGPGVLTTDAAIHDGLELASFSEDTTSILKKNLPKTANIKNPVDVIGDARIDRYNIALSAAFDDPGVAGVFVILTPQSMTDIDLIAREVAKVSSHYDKPVYTSFMGEADVQEGIEVLQRNKIPHYSQPEYMSKAFAAVYNFSLNHYNHVKPAKYADIHPEITSAILNNAVHKNSDYLTEETAQKVLAAYGLPVLDSYVANDAEQAVELAGKAGFPVVMKVLSDEIVHKYDMGGVVINIKDTNEAEKAYNSIIGNVKKLRPDAKIKGVLVRRMIPEGVEVILGVKRDSSFNTVVMFGLGGIFVEIFKDVSFRVAPIDKKTAESMINEIKSSALLKGARGSAIRDIPAIVDSIQRLSQLAVDHPQIKELDINPMIVLEEGNGCFIADAKIMVTLNKS